jgi:predicted RNA-binding Zn-ribbon protein involved in translation (DUF1610 family)
MATCDFGTTEASATEVLMVRSGANPVWYLRISDIPLFSIGLLLLTLLALYVSYRAGRRIKSLEKGGLIKQSGPAESVITKRALDASTNLVECVECGNPIEISTTRRPIEVMCPHCGEIQHIQ